MMNWKSVEDRITSRSDIQGGKPCLRNTRTPVYAILESLAMGMSFETVQKEFAPITEEDIRACIYYATVLSNEEEVFRKSA